MAELGAASEAMADELRRLQFAESGGLAIDQLRLLHETSKEVLQTEMLAAEHAKVDVGTIKLKLLVMTSSATDQETRERNNTRHHLASHFTLTAHPPSIPPHHQAPSSTSTIISASHPNF